MQQTSLWADLASPKLSATAATKLPLLKPIKLVLGQEFAHQTVAIYIYIYV